MGHQKQLLHAMIEREKDVGDVHDEQHAQGGFSVAYAALTALDCLVLQLQQFFSGFSHVAPFSVYVF